MSDLEKLELIKRSINEMFPGVAYIACDIALLNEAGIVLDDWIKKEKEKKNKGEF